MTATAATFTVTMPSKRPIMKNTAVAMLPPSGKAPPFVGRLRRPVGRPPKNRQKKSRQAFKGESLAFSVVCVKYE